MTAKGSGLPIGRMAKAVGVNVETIRFYQRKGLLKKPRRERGAITRYHSPDVARIRFVKSAQRLGFTLDEIAALLRLDDGTHCQEAREMAEHKLADVRSKLLDLERMESALERVVNDCCATKGPVPCPLIAALKVDAP
jgi:MerR family transcriptional regulator, mercuric resistance operon regulatory protein